MEEENTETHRSIPTFLSKPAGQHSAMVTHGVHKSLHVLRRSRRLWRRGGSRELKVQQIKEVMMMTTVEEENKNGATDCVVKQQQEEEEEEEEEEEDDREEIERKIHALQRIVPGGESLGVDKLFDETAGYIMALQCQVKALRTLAGFFDKLEKENTKFGG